ncbi:hypothetical protein EVAR_554_1 [Eumeta japonica]|uniref:Uncharacterized protein n=1 Tax=Eumeta variegata TaxID=151549 RepID=A0A4C1SDM6_EUMVA|nr:hypothetical protein EVAR_554_1 [Eumeta japonica]
MQQGASLLSSGRRLVLRRAIILNLNTGSTVVLKCRVPKLSNRDPDFASSARAVSGLDSTFDPLFDSNPNLTFYVSVSEVVLESGTSSTPERRRTVAERLRAEPLGLKKIVGGHTSALDRSRPDLTTIRIGRDGRRSAGRAGAEHLDLVMNDESDLRLNLGQVHSVAGARASFWGARGQGRRRHRVRVTGIVARVPSLTLLPKKAAERPALLAPTPWTFFIPYIRRKTTKQNLRIV